MPTAVLIVCGAPLAERAGDMAGTLTNAGWNVHVVGTPSSVAWVDPATQANLSVRFEFRSPAHTKRIQQVDAVLVCPATFNTTNKIVSGTADNYAVSLACEAIGDGIPTVVVPMVNDKLWGHFGWQSALDALVGAGVRLVNVQTGELGAAPVRSGTGTTVVQQFDPGWLLKALDMFR